MITKKSPLILDSFNILNSKCEIIHSDDSSIDLLENTKSMPVDIDFSIASNEDDSILVFTKVEINNADNPLPGYSIFAEGVGLFHFEASLTEDEKKQLVNSSINICITNIRSYINTITSFYILGRFSFHAVDMPALLKSKADSINRDVNTDK